MAASSRLYEKLGKAGIPAEDARFVLPNATETKILVTMNARELHHFFSLRTCRRAQWEIREMALRMLAIARKEAPLLFESGRPRLRPGEVLRGQAGLRRGRRGAPRDRRPGKRGGRMTSAEPKELVLGGQAVIEGVMMKGPETFAVAVRKASGEIKVRDFPLTESPARKRFAKVPLVRGVWTMAAMLVIGYKALQFSADEAIADEEGDGIRRADGKAGGSRWPARWRWPWSWPSGCSSCCPCTRPT